MKPKGLTCGVSNAAVQEDRREMVSFIRRRSRSLIAVSPRVSDSSCGHVQQALAIGCIGRSVGYEGRS